MRISDWSSDVCSSDLNQRWRSRFEVTDDIGAVRLQIANRLDSRFDAHDNLQSKFSPNIDRFRVHAISVETTGDHHALHGVPPSSRSSVRTYRNIQERHRKHGTETRSEERRVGKECVSTCRSRRSLYH